MCSHSEHLWTHCEQCFWREIIFDLALLTGHMFLFLATVLLLRLSTGMQHLLWKTMLEIQEKGKKRATMRRGQRPHILILGWGGVLRCGNSFGVLSTLLKCTIFSQKILHTKIQLSPINHSWKMSNTLILVNTWFPVTGQVWAVYTTNGVGRCSFAASAWWSC